MLRIHPQLQTSENTQDLSAATDLRDGALMGIHLEAAHFQVQCGKCTVQEQGETSQPRLNQTLFPDTLFKQA